MVGPDHRDHRPDNRPADLELTAPALRIAVLKETAPGETRVALTPETAKKFIGLGATVAVESGAGVSASIPDAAYIDAGAEVGPAAQW